MSAAAGPIRVVIAEDEDLAREKLRRWIVAEPDLELVGEAASGPAALRALEAHRPELLFLDVRLPGFGGLEVLSRAPHRPYVIFTTAYAEHAVAAFELEAVDYLLKPFGPARFHSALDRVRRRRVGGSHDEAGARLYAVERGRVRAIPLAEVRRFEARDDYVAAWTGGGRYLLSIRLASLAARLDARRFVRIHRSHVVNLDHVSSVTRLGSGRWRVAFADGAAVDTSRAGGRRLRASLARLGAATSAPP